MSGVNVDNLIIETSVCKNAVIQVVSLLLFFAYNIFVLQKSYSQPISQVGSSLPEARLAKHQQKHNIKYKTWSVILDSISYAKELIGKGKYHMTTRLNN